MGYRRLLDTLLAFFGRLFAFLPLVLVSAFLCTLGFKAWPSVHRFGLHFFTQTHWIPVQGLFGGLGPIEGTLITSFVALLFAVPISFGVGVLIVYYLSGWAKTVLSRSLDLMAGIPSIVYGVWGIFYLVPFLKDHVYPSVLRVAHIFFPLRWLFGTQSMSGIGILTASIVLALMIIPIIASVMRDVMQILPRDMREAAHALGANRVEFIFSVLVPYVKGGLMGGIVLGLGRALGETMAVTFVIGNSHAGFGGLLLPGSTIASTIANEFAEATDPLHQSALVELGLILFLISLLTFFCIHFLLRRMRGGNRGAL